MIWEPPVGASRKPFPDIDEKESINAMRSEIVLARSAGEEAQRQGNAALMQVYGAELERCADYIGAARLLASAGRLELPGSLPEWDGGTTSRTLLVRQRIRHIGAPIRLGRLIPLAAARTGACIVLAEPRLIPLFRRSYPMADIRRGDRVAEAVAEAQVEASYETLMEHLAADASSIRRGFSPLKADPRFVYALRSRYAVGERPVIGISWTSTNVNKSLPSLGDWAGFLRRSDALFVSLQYGAVQEDLEALRSESGAHIIHDPDIDPLHDLDGFAAQVSAMDGVITISNTTAHMSGALGVPTIVLLDEHRHLMWPYAGDTTPWYPSTILLRQAGRQWSEVLADARIERMCGATRG